MLKKIFVFAATIALLPLALAGYSEGAAYPSRPLDRPSLTERLAQMAGGTGLRLTGVFNLELSKDTKKANAMLARVKEAQTPRFEQSITRLKAQYGLAD